MKELQAAELTAAGDELERIDRLFCDVVELHGAGIFRRDELVELLEGLALQLELLPDPDPLADPLDCPLGHRVAEVCIDLERRAAMRRAGLRLPTEGRRRKKRLHARERLAKLLEEVSKERRHTPPKHVDPRPDQDGGGRGRGAPRERREDLE
jgi:hypothetical protein